MAISAHTRPTAGSGNGHGGAASDQATIGELVATASRDVSLLIHQEVELAKTEMKGDARRVGMAVAGIGLAAFVGCLVLVLVCFAFAYGLITLGIWDWAAFLIVAGTCVLLAGVAVGIALLKLSKLSGLSRTRKTVTEGLGMLRHEVQYPDGQRPELAARKTR